MRLTILLFCLLAGNAVFAQSFVFTLDSVYRAENIRADGKKIYLFNIDSNQSKRVIPEEKKVYIIVFSSSTQRYFFNQSSTRNDVDLKVLEPLPAWLKDSVFTGPVDLGRYSLKLKSPAYLPDSLVIPYNFYSAAHSFDKFRKQSLTGLCVSAASPLVFLAMNALLNKMPTEPIGAGPAFYENYLIELENYNRMNLAFTGLAVAGALTGTIIWIDAYKHIGRASTHLKVAGTQINLRLKF